MIYNGWTQPILGKQLNTSHPLSRGLVASYLLNEGGGTKALNTVTNKISTLSGGVSGNAIFVKTQRYNATRFNGVNTTGSRLIIDTPWTDFPTTYTCSCWFRSDNITVASKYLLCWRNPSNTSIWWQINCSSSVVAFTVGTSGSNIFACVSGALQSNTWYNVTCVRNNLVLSLYLNGLFVSTVSLITNATPTVLQDNVIGCQSGDYNAVFNGDINNAKTWKRALNSTEIMQLYLSPNCMYSNKISSPLYSPSSPIINTSNFFQMFY